MTLEIWFNSLRNDDNTTETNSKYGQTLIEFMACPNTTATTTIRRPAGFALCNLWLTPTQQQTHQKSLKDLFSILQLELTLQRRHSRRPVGFNKYDFGLATTQQRRRSRCPAGFNKLKN
jgi:hypothetical protein